MLEYRKYLVIDHYDAQQKTIAWAIWDKNHKYLVVNTEFDSAQEAIDYIEKYLD